MDLIKIILEEIFSEEEAFMYFQIFKVNEITDEIFKGLTNDDINILFPDQDDRDKIIRSFAQVFTTTTESFTWPRESKPDGQGSSYYSRPVLHDRIDSAFSGSGSSSEPETELLPKRTKKNDAGGESNGGGSSSNNGNCVVVHKVPEEILEKRFFNNKMLYRIKWAGIKKMVTWEWSCDEKLEGYQYMIRDFEREQEKEVVNEDCNILDDEMPGPSGSPGSKSEIPNHNQKDNRGQGQGSKDYRNYEEGNVNTATATQNNNGPSHHEIENENILPNPHHNNMNGVAEFPMFEETKSYNEIIRIIEGQSLLESIIKTEKTDNPAKESVPDPTQSITIPDIYSNLSMEYQDLDDDSKLNYP